MTEPDSTTPAPDSTTPAPDSPTPSDPPSPTSAPEGPPPGDSPPPAEAAADSSKLDQMLALLERALGGGAAAGTQLPTAAAAAAAQVPAPVQQEQQTGTPGAVVVTPPAVVPEVSVPTPPVREPEQQTVIVAQPVTPSVTAPPRQLKTGDRVIHRYHDDYGSGPGGDDVTDYGLVVEQSAKQIDDGNGASHLQYFSRVAWLREVSDPLDEGSLELQP